MKQMYRIVLILFVACVGPHSTMARTQVFFSPDDQLTKKFIELIRGAKRSLVGAIYLISDKVIATEFIEAKKRGVDVKLIVDYISTHNYGKAQMLVQGGVDVFLYKPYVEDKKKPEDKNTPRDFFDNDPIMHNKFLVVDNRSVWTGSFNWTVSANRKNQENAVLLDERDVCEKYSHRFQELVSNHCKPFKQSDKNSLQEVTCIDECDEGARERFLLDMNLCT